MHPTVRTKTSAIHCLPELAMVCLTSCLLCLAVSDRGLAQTNRGKQETGQTISGGREKSRPRKTGKSEPNPAARTILVFPPDTKGGLSDQLTDTILAVEESRLQVSGEYRPLVYRKSIATVRRALQEQALTQADVNPPFDEDSKLKRVTPVTGYDLALVTSLSDYSYDAQKQQASLVMTARLIDYAGKTPVVRSGAVSATTAEKALKDANDVAPVIQLARQLTEQLMTQVLKPAKSAGSDSAEPSKPAAETQPASPTKPKKGSRKKQTA